MTSEQMQVFALDVGQGDCTFIIPPGDGNHAVLFDCHDSYVAERFVADHKLTCVTVVISHLDRDHVVGIRPFLQWCLEEKGVVVDSVWIARDRVLKRGKAKNIRQLITYLTTEADRDGFRLRMPVRENQPKVIMGHEKDDWSVELVLPWYRPYLAAGVTEPEEPNCVSVVLRARLRKQAVLIGGDAPLIAWESLEPPLRRAIAVRVPHHGGKIDEGSPTLTYGELYNSIEAGTAVVSVGTHNGFGHPLAGHVEAARRDSACRVVCTQLTPRCATDPQACRATTLAQASGVVYPYRHRPSVGEPVRSSHGRRTEVPCAGSVAIWLDPDGTVAVEPGPDDPWHGRFVRTLDTPLCVGVTGS